MSNFQVYSSSAGSGKTYTLALSFIALALKGGSSGYQQDYYRRILAITFTNKAAVEMKDRVLNYLISLSNGKDIDNIINWLIKETKLEKEVIFNRAKFVHNHILHHYTDLSISTIDKFTYRIVRTFASELGLSQNFDLEIDNYKIIQPVVALLLSRISEKEKDLSQLLIDFAFTKIEDGKSTNIERDLELFSEELFKEETSQYLEKENLSIKTCVSIRSIIQKQVKDCKNKILDLSKRTSHYFNSHDLTSEYFIRGTFYNHFTKNLCSDDYKKWIPSETLQHNMLNNNWYSDNSRSEIKAAVESCKPELTLFFNELMDLIVEYNSCKLVLKNIFSISILNELVNQIKLYKIDQNIEQISVFNKKIHHIISTQPSAFIYERLGERYNHYLIDEFQDTSILQWQNFLPLITDSLDYGKSLVVGDGKQSIYRWRGGEVEQFLQLPEIYGANHISFKDEWENKLIQHYDQYTLNKNFRSRKEIVKFNNLFFDKLKVLLPPKIRNIYANHKQEVILDNKKGYVHIELFSNKDIDFKLLILQKMLEEIRSLKKDCLFSYKDITILCNSRNRVSLVAEYLSENEIPVISNEGLLLKQSKKVNLIIAFLMYLKNQEDAIARSVIILYLQKNILTSYSLHELNLKANTRHGFSRVLHLSNINLNESTLLERPLYQLIEQLIMILNLKEDIYVQFFLDFVLDYSEKQINGLSAFLHFWEQQRDKQAIVIPEGLDAVKIMTIHKSKGLAFNVVMIPFNWEDTQNLKEVWVNTSDYFNKTLPFSLIPLAKSTEYSFFKETYLKETSLSLLDNMNKLYVAMTRARQRLYIFSKEFPVKPSKDFVRKGQLNSFLYHFSNHYPIILGSGNSNDDICLSNTNLNKSFLVNKVKKVDWREVVSLKHSAEEIWDIENNNSKKDWGKLLHKALSNIHYKEETEDVLNRLFISGQCNEENFQRLSREVYMLLEDPNIAKYFTKNWHVKTEKEILTNTGRTYIPDRLLFDKQSDQVIIIDYKTGEEKDRHIKQIRDYANALKKMGYNNIKEILIYTSKKDRIKPLCSLS